MLFSIYYGYYYMCNIYYTFMYKWYSKIAYKLTDQSVGSRTTAPATASSEPVPPSIRYHSERDLVLVKALLTIKLPSLLGPSSAEETFVLLQEGWGRLVVASQDQKQAAEVDNLRMSISRVSTLQDRKMVPVSRFCARLANGPFLANSRWHWVRSS